jgi:farnesyl diphosphate synthase
VRRLHRSKPIPVEASGFSWQPRPYPRRALQDNKCSWPINLALSLASPAQRQTLDANYGVRSAETEAKVKAVYAELDIQAKFDAYEAKSYREINEAIEQVDEAKTGLKREVFRSFLAKVYKRTK